MGILLTGFNPFGDHAANPSELIVQCIAERNRRDVIAEVLPTEFQAAGNRMRALIHQHRPDAVVSLGLAAGRTVISLERFAVNMNDAAKPDNAGDLAQGRVIVPDGPAAYGSTLPLEPIRDALQAKNIPVGFSNHAGAFVCNHIFYIARHELEQLGSSAKCGFIHVPLIAADASGLPLETLVAAVECVLDVVGRT